LSFTNSNKDGSVLSFICVSDTWGENYDADAASTYDYDSGHECDHGGVPEISDDFALFDGEVGRRLTNMDSIPVSRMFCSACPESFVTVYSL
jgi:hypothetical protein